MTRGGWVLEEYLLSAEEYRRRIAERVADIESQAALKRQLLDRPTRGAAG